MVVGSGMMAKAFSAFRENSQVVIFASGVSNSLETARAAFARERELLRQVRIENPAKLLVYFGTCSVDDPDRRDTPYVGHKLEMESLVAGFADPWMILRVPLAIGRGNRGSTLARFLYERISHGECFEVWTNATRYPVDVEDVFRIATRLIVEPSNWNRTINIALRAFTVAEFVRLMERIVGKAAIYDLTQKGQHYDVFCPEVAKVAKDVELDFSDQYLERVLRKYFER
jgi:nucleoside-diphosphate-sugar epimerase